MIKFSVLDKALRHRLLRIKSTAQVPTRLWKKIHQHQQAMSGLIFRRNKHGGNWRFPWKWFAPQYKRKTDGVTVPAEGGVPRLDGRGEVLGRLRPSGARIDASSNLLRDTGQLANAVASVRRITHRGRVLHIVTPVDYAAAQQALGRTFTGFTREDRRTYRGWAIRELMR